MRKERLVDEKGAAMAEFTIAVMVFFLLIFGGIEFSRGVWQYNIVSNASKAAVRWAVVRGASSGQTAATATDVHNYIVTQMQGFSELDTVTWLPATKTRGDTVKVVVRSSYVVKPFPLLPAYTLNLRSAAKMIIAR